ncbi:MAG: hypothetical protein NC419_13095 [Muribaculaceae bacterium]|nr:hypothetical protein [Muribaculaceae bacterium]
MEKTLQLELDRHREKPVFHLGIDGGEQIRCLLDSGAAIPVWCGTEKLLKKCFDVKKLNKRTWLSGFGGKGEYHDVYSIPSISLKGTEGTLTIHNFIVILAPNQNVKCDLIFGSLVFHNKIDYAINTRNNNRHIKLKYDKDVYTMFVKDSPDIVRNVYIASSDDMGGTL